MTWYYSPSPPASFIQSPFNLPVCPDVILCHFWATELKVNLVLILIIFFPFSGQLKRMGLCSVEDYVGGWKGGWMCMFVRGGGGWSMLVVGVIAKYFTEMFYVRECSFIGVSHTDSCLIPPSRFLSVCLTVYLFMSVCRYIYPPSFTILLLPPLLFFLHSSLVLSPLSSFSYSPLLPSLHPSAVPPSGMSTEAVRCSLRRRLMP